MGCFFLKQFIRYSPHSLSGTFSAYIKPISNDCSKKIDPKQQNRRDIVPLRLTKNMWFLTVLLPSILEICIRVNC